MFRPDGLHSGFILLAGRPARNLKFLGEVKEPAAKTNETKK